MPWCVLHGEIRSSIGCHHLPPSLVHYFIFCCRSNSSLSRPSSRNGLESPSLLRRVILPPDDSRATPPPPPLSPSPSSRSSSLTNNNGYKESSPFLSVVNNASSVMENSFGQINSDSLSWQQKQQNNSQPPERPKQQNGAVQNGDTTGLTWLQKQQHKLEERRRQQSQQGRDSSFLMKVVLRYIRL